MLKAHENISARPLGRTAVTLAGFGAALVLASPSGALAGSRACSVPVSVTSSTNNIGALQVKVNYTAAAAKGAFGTPPTCTFAPAGSTSANDDLVHTLTAGYADTTGFDGPSLFVTCSFVVPDSTDAAPTAADFIATVDDAPTPVCRSPARVRRLSLLER